MKGKQAIMRYLETHRTFTAKDVATEYGISLSCITKNALELEKKRVIIRLSKVWRTVTYRLATPEEQDGTAAQLHQRDISGVSPESGDEASFDGLGEGVSMKSTVETKIIELVKSGHELAKELHCAESAALVSDLASQLEVQFARSNALAAENAYLMPKAASELSNAWVLHKYLIGIQAAIMYLDNGNKKAAQEWLYGTIAGPGFEFPDEVDDIDEWATHQMRGSISHPRAIEIIKEETPATDAFLAEVRAQGVDTFGDYLNGLGWDESDIKRVRDFAAQLRKGVRS